jgi:hypothetical protein
MLLPNFNAVKVKVKVKVMSAKVTRTHVDM